jgi:putative salt-induced outer membrane protein
MKLSINRTLNKVLNRSVINNSLVIASAIFLQSTSLYAEEVSTTDAEATWDASVELGYVSVSGNTDTDTFNGRFSLSYEIEKWLHSGFITTQTSSSENNLTAVQSSAEKYTAQAKTEYKYSDKAYSFGIFDYDKTKGSGFDYQYSYAVGVGYNFIKNKIHKLDGEIGFGSRESKTEIDPFVTNQETITRLAGSYSYKISKTSKLEQKLSSEIGEDNSISKSYTGLSANILENLAMKVSYTAKHQSEVPEGNEELETVTSFTVVYTF